MNEANETPKKPKRLKGQAVWIECGRYDRLAKAAERWGVTRTHLANKAVEIYLNKLEKTRTPKLEVRS